MVGGDRASYGHGENQAQDSEQSESENQRPNPNLVAGQRRLRVAKARNDAQQELVQKFNELTGSCCSTPDFGLSVRELMRWQANHGLEPTGELSDDVIAAAQKAADGKPAIKASATHESGADEKEHDPRVEVDPHEFQKEAVFVLEQHGLQVPPHAAHLIPALVLDGQRPKPEVLRKAPAAKHHRNRKHGNNNSIRALAQALLTPEMERVKTIIGMFQADPNAKKRATASSSLASTAATHGVSAPNPSPLPSAGAAMHDGGAGHALGEGDEVFTTDAKGKSRVIAAFPSTPEGVVAAAFYELHRGDKRPLAEIMADSSEAKTTRNERAAKEGKHEVTHTNKKTGEKYTAIEGTNDDAAGKMVIGHKAGKITESGALGPVEAYVESVHASLGIPWCGSFATFVYRRAGIDVQTLQYSLDVPNVLASSATRNAQGQYYHTTGKEGSAKVAGRNGYVGQLEEGEHGKSQKYHKHEVKSLEHLDIRPGDVFWQEHASQGGHVGIIVGVHRTANTVTVVTIEGNASDQLLSKVHTVSVDGSGQVKSTFKGWGRPAELAGAPAQTTDAEEPEWIKNAEHRYKHSKDTGRDR
jgi:hypothetical protein